MPLHNATYYKRKQTSNARRRSKNPDVPVDVSTGYDHYAMVLKRLGNNRLQIKLYNGQEVQAVIPGRFMKKIWLTLEKLEEDGLANNLILTIQRLFLFLFLFY